MHIKCLKVYNYNNLTKGVSCLADEKLEEIRKTLLSLGAKNPDRLALPPGTGGPNTIKVDIGGKYGAINRTYKKDNGYNFGTFQLPGGSEQLTFDEEAAVRANNPQYAGKTLFTKDEVDRRFLDLVKGLDPEIGK